MKAAINRQAATLPARNKKTAVAQKRRQAGHSKRNETSSVLSLATCEAKIESYRGRQAARYGE